MEQTEGIITVIDQASEQEDDALVALRELPKFEPLVVPDQPTHFSLASVFGALSTTNDSKHSSSDMTFTPSVLVDMLIQMNVHNKQCAQDIQEFQRSLAQKVRALDSYAAGAVQNLSAIHQQAKSHSDQLLSVHAITKQASTTTALLHGIIEKINLISDHLPADSGVETISAEKYPNLYQYLHQTPPHAGHGRASTTSEIGSSMGSGLMPSGLALLGHNPTAQYSTKAAALSVPKARASMALAPSTLTYLSMHATSEQSGDGDVDFSSERTTTLYQMSRSKNTSNQRVPSGTDQPKSTPLPTLRASDNLRRLANKSP